MNWKRGLFRVWLVSTAAWLAVQLWESMQTQLALVVGWFGSFRVGDARQAGYSGSKILRHLSGGTAEIILVSLAVFLFGAAALWALEGFKQSHPDH